MFVATMEDQGLAISLYFNLLAYFLYDPLHYGIVLL